MYPVILYRGRDFEQHEIAAARKAGFLVVDSRCACGPNNVVVGRYSVLPYYLELQKDLAKVGARLINSYHQHQYIADIKEWYEDLQHLTPKTWFRLQDVPKDCAPFVVKGATNSKKFQWNELMFAKTWDGIGPIFSRLQDDGLIGGQDIYVRRYVPLKTYTTTFHELPITDEYRFFFYKGQVVASGYYWSCHFEDLQKAGHRLDASNVPYPLIQEVGTILADKAPFVAVDFAQTEDGRWIIIEINDGQMSGLSECKPEELYTNLFKLMEPELATN